MKTDFLIVGQGIGGSILAFVLQQKGYSVVVVSSEQLPKASLVAAGVYNPVVFKRITYSWHADQAIKSMYYTLTEMQNMLYINILHEKKVVKLFNNKQEKDFWQRKMNEPEFIEMLDCADTPLCNNNTIDHPQGYGIVVKSGFVDLPVLLSAYQKHLIQQQCFYNELFEYDKLLVHSNNVTYKHIEAGCVVFAEGVQAMQNPYFPNLHFNLCKGEVLTLHIPDLRIEHIINSDAFLVPQGDGYYRAGTTYEWKQLDNLPSKQGHDMIMDKIQKFVKCKIDVVDHKAGIRPTVTDRRPLMGKLPMHDNMFIFNGLGTRGVMLAPYLAVQMVSYINGNTEALHAEADIQRFNNK